MSYRINDIPLSDYLFDGGWIGSGSNASYALDGIWSLPARIGTTYHDWGSSLEPYTDADDIIFDYRTFTISVTTRAKSVDLFRERLDALYTALGDSFTLSHDTLGSFAVILIQSDVESYQNGWGLANLRLRELRPVTIGELVKLPAITTPATYGIDGYSWSDLGLVVSSFDGRYNIPQWQPLAITAQNHTCGSRDIKTITIKGTVRGVGYDGFKSKVELLQAAIGHAGVRTIRHFDGSVLTAFCVDGFTIDGVTKFADGTHWGTIQCKMIEI